MQTNLFTTTTSSTGAVQLASSSTSDMFTKLLVAQIQNQDPLSPTDPSEFVNQLAQLSQTESLDNLSNLTSSNASILQSLQVLGLGAQVGSEVAVNTDSVQLGTEKVSGTIALAASSSKTTLVLTGDDGVKHEVTLGTLAAGTVPFALDPAVLGLPAGKYSMEVQTSSSEKPSVDIFGKLSSVRLSASGGTILNVANVGEVAPAAVTGFNGKPAVSTI